MNNCPSLHPQSRWSAFYKRRTLSLATTLYRWRKPAQLPQVVGPITIVCISDTHTTQPQLQGGDLLPHAGDPSQNGSFNEIQAQLDWLNTQPHKHKIVIGGNHDLLLDPVFVDRFPARIFEGPGSRRSDLRWGSVIYLQDDFVDLQFDNRRKLKIYGAPSTQQFGNWPFQYPPIRVFGRESCHLAPISFSPMGHRSGTSMQTHWAMNTYSRSCSGQSHH